MDGGPPLYLRSIPFHSSSEAVLSAVREALEADALFELIRTHEWSDLVRLAAASGFCVIDLSEGFTRADLTRVLELRLTRPGLGVVAIVRSGGRTVRDVATDLIRVPCGPHVISRAVRTASFRVRRHELRARVLGCDASNQVLREGVLHVLRQGPAEPGLRAVVDPETLPLRRVNDLAEELGYDPRRLRRAGDRVSVDIRAALHLWLVIGALALREHSGMDFDVVAWRLGYRTRSGLSNLVRRVLDLSLEQAATTPAEVWLSRFEQEVVEPMCVGGSSRKRVSGS